MGRYTTEPSRRSCLLHLSFNFFDGDTAIDLSPQENDGTVIGSTETTVGAVGQAFQGNQNSYVEVDAELNVDQFTFTAWLQKPAERNDYGIIEKRTTSGTAAPFDVRVVSGTLKATVNDGTATAEVTDTAPTDPYFVAVTYDQNVLRLVVGDEEVDQTNFVADQRTLVDNAEPTTIAKDIDTEAVLVDGWIDDVRLYDSVLSDEQIADIRAIGTDHQSIGALRDGWNNQGVPFRGNNQALAGALGEEFDYVKRQLDYVLDGKLIDSASGVQLDRIGLLANVKRDEDESDARYRARIKGTFAAARSSGTFEDITRATAAVIDSDPNDIELSLQVGGVGTVFIPFEEVEDSPLQPTDISTIVNDTVVGGHRVDVVQRGAQPFTVRSDTQTNDPENGLTSDSISTGGGLTSDFN